MSNPFRAGRRARRRTRRTRSHPRKLSTRSPRTNRAKTSAAGTRPSAPHAARSTSRGLPRAALDLFELRLRAQQIGAQITRQVVELARRQLPLLELGLRVGRPLPQQEPLALRAHRDVAWSRVD